MAISQSSTLLGYQVIPIQHNCSHPIFTKAASFKHAPPIRMKLPFKN